MMLLTNAICNDAKTSKPNCTFFQTSKKTLSPLKSSKKCLTFLRFTRFPKDFPDLPDTVSPITETEQKNKLSKIRANFVQKTEHVNKKTDRNSIFFLQLRKHEPKNFFVDLACVVFTSANMGG